MVRADRNIAVRAIGSRCRAWQPAGSILCCTATRRAAMAAQTVSRPSREAPTVALMLQGGGALGAYHIGAYQAMAEHDLHPDWVASISIGAINAAIIAGNRP